MSACRGVLRGLRHELQRQAQVAVRAATSGSAMTNPPRVPASAAAARTATTSTTSVAATSGNQSGPNDSSSANTIPPPTSAVTLTSQPAVTFASQTVSSVGGGSQPNLTQTGPTTGTGTDIGGSGQPADATSSDDESSDGDGGQGAVSPVITSGPPAGQVGGRGCLRFPSCTFRRSDQDYQPDGGRVVGDGWW